MPLRPCNDREREQLLTYLKDAEERHQLLSKYIANLQHHLEQGEWYMDKETELAQEKKLEQERKWWSEFLDRCDIRRYGRVLTKGERETEIWGFPV